MPTARFFALTFAITWGLQLPGVLARWGWLPGETDAYLPLAVLGIFGPTIAAMICARREPGGVRALLGPLRIWRVPVRYYFVALLLPGLLLTIGLALMNLAGREGPLLYLPAAPQLVAGILISFTEEIGWRGYALPRLIPRYGAFAASGILGVLWALWHIPMFLATDVPMTLMPVMVLYFVGGSLTFTWLHLRTGSLLLIVLAHLGAHLDNCTAALPGDSVPLLVETVVYAGLGLGLMWPEAFKRPRGRKLEVV